LIKNRAIFGLVDGDLAKRDVIHGIRISDFVIQCGQKVPVFRV
jgi:hypothetical protein